jgi:hypothetical protein
MRCSDSLPLISPHFVSFAWRYHLVRLIRSHQTGRTPSVGQEVCSPVPPLRDVRWKRQGLPGSWGSLFRHALLFDPGETGAPCLLRRPGTAFRSLNSVGSRICGDFGAQSHGLPAPCVRFAAGVAAAPRNTRYRLVANLCRAGFFLQSPSTRFQGGALAIYPPYPGFPWRTKCAPNPVLA